MTTTAIGTLTARLGLFEQAACYATDVLAGVRPADLGRPTPCPGWDVRTVVLHLADVADAVIGLTVTGELTMPAPRPATIDDPVKVAGERIEALRQVLTSRDAAPAELLTGAAQGGANELAAHAWDIATSIGLDLPVPASTAAGLLALVEGALDDAARGSNFGPAVPVPATAPPGDRFVAYLGRRPH